MTAKTQPTNLYFEWWLRDWIRSGAFDVFDVSPDTYSQDIIDQWGATRRRQLTWAGLLERCVDESPCDNKGF